MAQFQSQLRVRASRWLALESALEDVCPGVAETAAAASSSSGIGRESRTMANENKECGSEPVAGTSVVNECWERRN